jgi:hypothetical protein
MSDKSTASSPVEALKGGFRRACVRRLVGDEDGAISVLRDEIPKLVVGWAKSTNLEAGEKKAKLKEMFDDESARADELATAFDLFAGRFERRVADLVTREIRNACARIERVAGSFEEILKKMADFPKESENIVLPESSQVPELVKSEISEIFEDNETKVEEEIGISLPIEEAKGEEVGEKVIEVVEEEEVDVGGDQAELDEPLGLGLKFDEIEEMIDEVLSMEN